jgi:flavorubredoxin
MKEMGVELTGEALRAKNVPNEAVLKECYERGEALAEKICSAVG